MSNEFLNKPIVIESIPRKGEFVFMEVDGRNYQALMIDPVTSAILTEVAISLLEKLGSKILDSIFGSSSKPDRTAEILANLISAVQSIIKEAFDQNRLIEANTLMAAVAEDMRAYNNSKETSLFRLQNAALTMNRVKASLDQLGGIASSAQLCASLIRLSVQQEFFLSTNAPGEWETFKTMAKNTLPGMEASLNYVLEATRALVGPIQSSMVQKHDDPNHLTDEKKGGGELPVKIGYTCTVWFVDDGRVVSLQRDSGTSTSVGAAQRYGQETLAAITAEIQAMRESAMNNNYTNYMERFGVTYARNYQLVAQMAAMS